MEISNSAYLTAGIKDQNHNLRSSGGPADFAVEGNVHHYIGVAEPAEGEQLNFLQMYIYDPDNEVSNRTVSQPSKTLDAELIAEVLQELDEFNPHVRMFRQLDLAGENARNKVLLRCFTGIIYCVYFCNNHIATAAHCVIVLTTANVSQGHASTLAQTCLLAGCKQCMHSVKPAQASVWHEMLQPCCDCIITDRLCCATTIL